MDGFFRKLTDDLQEIADSLVSSRVGIDSARTLARRLVNPKDRSFPLQKAYDKVARAENSFDEPHPAKMLLSDIIIGLSDLANSHNPASNEVYQQSLWKMIKRLKSYAGETTSESYEGMEVEPPAGGKRGVSLRDAALAVNDNDPEPVADTVKRWHNTRKLPEPIGGDPKHRQRQLYSVEDILKFIDDEESPATASKCKRVLRNLARNAVPRDPETHSTPSALSAKSSNSKSHKAHRS